MTNANPTVLAICATVLLVAVLGAITVLAYESKIPPAAAVGIFTVIVSGGLALIGVHSGVTAGARAAKQER